MLSLRLRAPIVLIALAAVCVVTPAAQAATTLTASQPAVPASSSEQLQITVSRNSDSAAHLFIFLQHGNGPCAATVSGEQAVPTYTATWSGGDYSNVAPNSPSTFTARSNSFSQMPGSGPGRVCVYLQKDGDASSLPPLATAEFVPNWGAATAPAYPTLSVTPGAVPSTGIAPNSFTVTGSTPYPAQIVVSTRSAAAPCPAAPTGNDGWVASVQPGAFSMVGSGLSFLSAQPHINEGVQTTGEPTYRLCAYITATENRPGGFVTTAAAAASAPWATAACPTGLAVLDAHYKGSKDAVSTFTFVVSVPAAGKVVGALGPNASLDGAKALGNVTASGPGTYTVDVSNAHVDSSVSTTPGVTHRFTLRYEPTVSGENSAPCLLRGSATVEPFDELSQSITIPSTAVMAAVKALYVGLAVTSPASTIVHAGGYDAHVRNQAAGTATITWYAVTGAKARTVLATGSKRTGRTGTTTLRVKLTAAGRKAVKRGATVFVSGTFKAAGQKPQSTSRTIKLR